MNRKILRTVLPMMLAVQANESHFSEGRRTRVKTTEEIMEERREAGISTPAYQGKKLKKHQVLGVRKLSKKQRKNKK